MGADLYIQTITNAAEEKYRLLFLAAVAKRDAFPGDSAEAKQAQKEVDDYYKAMFPEDGYYRDSYNATSVLWRLGLSWWQDVGPLLDNDYLMQPSKIRDFLGMIRDAPFTPATKEELLDQYAVVDDDENSVEGWNEFFQSERDRLIKFLEHAIELDESIYCSI